MPARSRTPPWVPSAATRYRPSTWSTRPPADRMVATTPVACAATSTTAAPRATCTVGSVATWERRTCSTASCGTTVGPHGLSAAAWIREGYPTSWARPCSTVASESHSHRSRSASTATACSRASRPQDRKSSETRVLSPVARGSVGGSARRSTTSTSRPWRPRVAAATSPAGPPPTTTASHRLSPTSAGALSGPRRSLRPASPGR